MAPAAKQMNNEYSDSKLWRFHEAPDNCCTEKPEFSRKAINLNGYEKSF